MHFKTLCRLFNNAAKLIASVKERKSSQFDVKVSKNRNDFMKTSFLPNTNKLIVRISAHYTIGQKS